MLASLMIAVVLATAPGPPLSPQARASIAPVLDAIAAERAAQAQLPPPKDDIERIIRLGRLDQAGRRALSQVDFSKAPEPERLAARKAMGDAIDEVDASNLSELLKLVPPEGWFIISKYGRGASRAAFHIIQHSNLELWRRFVPILEPLVAKGEVEGPDFALMYDRLEMNEGRPQRYGSQFKCVDGKFQLHPLQDPSRVDDLRRAVGLTTTMAEYVKAFEAMRFPC
jgi:hypothetical protein